MRKGKVCSMIVILLVYFITSGFSIPQVNIENSGFAIRYMLDATDPGSGKVQVTISVENYPNSYLRFETFKPHPEAVSFSNFQAWTGEDEEIAINSIGASGCSQPWNSWGCEVWQVNNGSQHDFKISYDAQPGYDPENFSDAQIGRIENDYMIFSGYSVFVVPKTGLAYNIYVDFSLPEAWELYTVWEEDENGYGYIPSIPGPDIRENLTSSGFAAGSNFNRYEKDIAGCLTQVLITDDFFTTDADGIADELFRGFTYQTEMFGVAPADRYLVIVTKPEDVRLFSIEWITSQDRTRGSGDIPEYGSLYHGSHHRWNGWLNGNWDLENSTTWLHEGTPDYYAVKIPYLLSTRMHSEGFKNDFINYYQNQLKSQDSPVSSQNANSMIYYRKGALVVSLLDYEITQRTSGEKTFDDFYAYMFQKYSAYSNDGQARWCSNSCQLNELNEFTGSDFTDFFNDYVYGVELPIEWLGSDDDDDFLYVYDEIMLSTDPELADTDGDGIDDGEEKISGSDPLDQNSLPEPTATATIVPTATATPEPTATEIMPTVTPDNQAERQTGVSALRNFFTKVILLVGLMLIMVYMIEKRRREPDNRGQGEGE